MGRHRRPGRTGRPVTGAVALVGALALGVVGTVAVVAVATQSEQTAAPPPCPTALRVVAAASYAPVLDGVAPALAAGPDCARLDVTVADGRTATARVHELAADVWIPDDAGWAGTPAPAELAEAPTAGAGTVLAASPIYLVTDRDTAQRVRDAGGGWLSLANLVTEPPAGAEPVRLAARDPGGSGDGMLGLGAVAEAVWEESGMDASAEALAAALPVHSDGGRRGTGVAAGVRRGGPGARVRPRGGTGAGAGSRVGRHGPGATTPPRCATAGSRPPLPWRTRPGPRRSTG